MGEGPRGVHKGCSTFRHPSAVFVLCLLTTVARASVVALTRSRHWRVPVDFTADLPALEERYNQRNWTDDFTIAVTTKI
ncbi:hypothetical protein PoB_003205700 [Plakobranchus ocellatus]|uniref:Uncharacterized protein n=1 Tax=Plakobranchus ocellatus TaxID=259542 RepID=A0AAV4AEX9_9GAST|nr:hypothetical protein PoB_003205700 [Plakobranchus ocellatus]